MAKDSKTKALAKYSRDSQGKIYHLEGKYKAHERQINSPNAKLKRAYRGDEKEGHSNRFITRELARLNLVKSPIWNKISSHS